MYDVVIVGAGPAGSTTASLLKRYRPDARVLIIDSVPFPRFHIGETLVTECNVVLQEMGAYDAVDGAGFIHKIGATFQLGPGDLWRITFGDMAMLLPPGAKVQTEYTWHVERARYDALLLEHARAMGAEFRLARAAGMVEENGEIAGVRLESGDELRARYVVDATGQRGLGSTARQERTMDPLLRNVAVSAYFRDFKPIERLGGNLDESRAYIVAHPHGWSWAFPIRRNLLSAGVVTTVDEFRRGTAGRGAEAFLTECLAAAPGLPEMLAGAELVVVDGERTRHMADFSYLANTMTRPRFFRVGDAAGFIDPILSVGLLLTHAGARYLAYTLNTLLGGDGADAGRLETAYADHVRDMIEAYREITYFFYQLADDGSSWWSEARRLMTQAAISDVLSDEEAFLAFASGFAARRSVFRHPTTVFDEPFFADAFRHFSPERTAPARAASERKPARTTAESRVTLRGALELRESAVPVDGAGTMAPSLRLEVRRDGDRGPSLVRRMHVPPSMQPLLESIDGARTVLELGNGLAHRLGLEGEQQRHVHRYTRAVIQGLVDRGLAELWT